MAQAEGAALRSVHDKHMLQGQQGLSGTSRGCSPQKCARHTHAGRARRRACDAVARALRARSAWQESVQRSVCAQHRDSRGEKTGACDAAGGALRLRNSSRYPLNHRAVVTAQGACQVPGHSNPGQAECAALSMCATKRQEGREDMGTRCSRPSAEVVRVQQIPPDSLDSGRHTAGCLCTCTSCSSGA